MRDFFTAIVQQIIVITVGYLTWCKGTFCWP